MIHENHVNASLLSCVLRQDRKGKSRAFYRLLYIESESRPIFRVILQSLRKPEVSLVKDEREKRVLSKLQRSLEILLTTRTCSGEESRWRVLVPSSQMDPSRRFLVFILGRFQTRKERETERCWERERESLDGRKQRVGRATAKAEEQEWEGRNRLCCSKVYTANLALMSLPSRCRLLANPSSYDNPLRPATHTHTHAHTRQITFVVRADV